MLTISKNTSFIIFLIFYSTSIKAQPTLEWEANFGGSEQEWCHRVIHTTDDNYVIAGSSKSVDGDLQENYGFIDAFILKIATDGNILWSKTLGSTGLDQMNNVEEDSDGNYIFFGVAGGTSGGVPGLGQYDFWVVKVDSNGNIIWENKYGGAKTDICYDGDVTNDGGYILVGNTRSLIASS